jgi:hypothetical protein
VRLKAIFDENFVKFNKKSELNFKEWFYERYMKFRFAYGLFLFTKNRPCQNNYKKYWGRLEVNYS